MPGHIQGELHQAYTFGSSTVAVSRALQTGAVKTTLVPGYQFAQLFQETQVIGDTRRAPGFQVYFVFSKPGGIAK